MSFLLVVWLMQEVDESGAEMFTVVLPSGTPLPARKHHTLRGGGKLTSLCVEVYQRFVTEQPEKLAKVRKNQSAASNLETNVRI